MRKETRTLRILRVLGLTIIWGLLITAALGCFAAGIWTLIPTELLDWGATSPNLIGYVSHCSYAPMSSLILFSGSIIGSMLKLRMKSSSHIGVGVLVGTLGGMIIGLLDGIGISMFIGMGIGVGLGIILGLLIGLLRNQDR
ncbi:MAG: hypothetical protein ACFE7R_06005 [Candidatus Hodarchaeota archaeon]